MLCRPRKSGQVKQSHSSCEADECFVTLLWGRSVWLILENAPLGENCFSVLIFVCFSRGEELCALPLDSVGCTLRFRVSRPHFHALCKGVLMKHKWVKWNLTGWCTLYLVCAAAFVEQSGSCDFCDEAVKEIQKEISMEKVTQIWRLNLGSAAFCVVTKISNWTSYWKRWMVIMIYITVSKLLQYNLGDKNPSFTGIPAWRTTVVLSWNETVKSLEKYRFYLVFCFNRQWCVRTSEYAAVGYWWYREPDEQWLSSEALLGLSILKPERLLGLNMVVSLYLSLCRTHQFLCVLSYVLSFPCTFQVSSKPQPKQAELTQYHTVKL